MARTGGLGSPQALRRVGLGIILPIVLLTVWQILGNSESPEFPRPSAWVEAVRQLAVDGPLWRAVGETVVTFLAGLAVAAVVGFVGGVWIGTSAVARSTVRPTMEFVRMVPPPAVIPAVVLLFGPDWLTRVLVVAFASLWPIILNVANSVAEAPSRLHDVSTSFGLSRSQMLRWTVIPHAVPSALIGIRVTAPIAIVVVLLTEMLTNAGGLGSLLIYAQRTYDAAGAFGLMCVVGVLGLLINSVTVRVSKAMSKNRGADGVH